MMNEKDPPKVCYFSLILNFKKYNSNDLSDFFFFENFLCFLNLLFFFFHIFCFLKFFKKTNKPVFHVFSCFVFQNRIKNSFKK